MSAGIVVVTVVVVVVAIAALSVLIPRHTVRKTGKVARRCLEMRRPEWSTATDVLSVIAEKLGAHQNDLPDIWVGGIRAIDTQSNRTFTGVVSVELCESHEASSACAWGNKGIPRPNSVTTSAVRAEIRTRTAARAEFRHLCKMESFCVRDEVLTAILRLWSSGA
jgi:hypothetical protein